MVSLHKKGAGIVSGGWAAASVVYNERKVGYQVIIPGPAVQLFPLVGPHEPEQFRCGVSGAVVFYQSPAPAGGREC